jgi:Flp pilus assembly protein TadG
VLVRHHVNIPNFRDESGQAAIEFALILPLLLGVLFMITEFSRTFNAYNDVNQMAANGARLAAVNRFPGTAALIAAEGDTKAVRDDASAAVTYPSGTCAVGDPVRVTVTVPIKILKYLPVLNVPALTLTGHAEMRIEAAPTGGC